MRATFSQFVRRLGFGGLGLFGRAAFVLATLPTAAAVRDVELYRDNALRIGGYELCYNYTVAPGWGKTYGNRLWSRNPDLAELGGSVRVAFDGKDYALESDFPTNCAFTAVRLSVELPLSLKWVFLDGERLDLPRSTAPKTLVRSGRFASIGIPLTDGRLAVLSGSFQAGLEDARHYGSSSFNLWLNVPRRATGGRAHYDQALSVSVRAAGGTPLDAYDWPRGLPRFRSLTFEEGPDWVTCDFARRTVPGSPLDFSFLNDAPAGKYGRVCVSADGHFAFADAPGKRIRFFGGNCSWNSAFLSHDDSDALAEELVRLGYNAVRLHQHDTQFLPKDATDSTEIDPAALDRFEYFIAAMKRRGIYLTTDCYSSRIFLKTDPGLAKYAGKHREMKRALMEVPEALENWKAFCRRLLTHRNPYTGFPLAEEPALLALNLVNEDGQPEAVRQRALHQEMMRYLKEDLGVRCPLTSLNNQSGPAFAWRRSVFDAIDLHQYYCHPARCRGVSLSLNSLASQFASAAPGGIWRENFLQRFYDRPCLLTEFLHVPPNVFRSESGPTMGAYAALQDLDGLLVYGYLENADSWTKDRHARNAFDTANDAFSLFGNKIAMLMFVRGDVAPARGGVCLEVPDDYARLRDATFPEAAKRLGLICRTGTALAGRPPVRGVRRVPLEEAEKVLGDLVPTTGVYVSDTREITLDTNRRQLRVVTPMTEALSWSYGRASGAFLAAGEIGAPQTVSCHSLDGKPLGESASMLVFHLTDSSNAGATYTDHRLRQQVGKPGGPMLIRRDRVRVRFGTGSYRLRALRCDGSVAGEVAPEADGGFVLRTDLFPGGILAYHLERRR